MHNIKNNVYQDQHFSSFHSNYFSVAPMLHWTDRHCRYFHRKLTKFSMLYTELITTKALLNSKNDYLYYNSEEHPLSLQLGGSDTVELAKCARLAEHRGYDEINFNVGCPSKRAQHGCFGACLMKQAHLVADCIKAMQDSVDIPVTVKTRIGIDNQDNYDFLFNFVRIVSIYGECKTFIIHARKALLSGMNPKKNRIIPPLNYSHVYQLKRDFPNLTIVLNGGIKSLVEAKLHLKHIDGVMIGREAYKNPNLLTNVDYELFNINKPIIDRINIVRSMYSYIEKETNHGTDTRDITRHMLGLFQGIHGARQWRQFLSTKFYKTNVSINILEKALQAINMSQ